MCVTEVRGAWTRRQLLERGAIGAGLAMAAPLLQACGGGAATAGGGGLGTVVVAAPSTPLSLDVDIANGIESFEAQHSVYDSLTMFPFQPVRDGIAAPDLSTLANVAPSLAEDFTQSKDGRSTSFKLRRGVISAAGNELTTADVQFLFQVLIAKSRGLRGLIAQLGNLDPSKAVVVKDRYSFELRSDAPSPLLLSGLSLVLAGVVDARAVRSFATASDPTAGKFQATRAAGFGPYRLDTLRQGQQAEFSARADYWGKQPQAKHVIMQALPQSNNRLAVLASGDAQIATGLTPVELEQAPRTANHPGNRQLWVAMQCAQAPFDDPDMRLAMQYATDYDAILSAVYRNRATRLYGPLPSTYPDDAGRELNRFEYDPERAKQLIAKAGHDRLTLELAYNSDAPNTREVALQLQAAWRKVGIETQINALTSVQWGTNYVTGAFKHLSMFLDQSNVPDMGYVSQLYFAKGAAANGGRYDNPRVNELTRRSIASMDPAERSEIARELQRLIIEDPAAVWIVQPGVHYGLNDPVRAVGWTTDNGIVYTRIAA
jgi:peptide/nickel transport system substrate-binding protein